MSNLYIFLLKTGFIKLSVLILSSTRVSLISGKQNSSAEVSHAMNANRRRGRCVVIHTQTLKLYARYTLLPVLFALMYRNCESVDSRRRHD